MTRLMTLEEKVDRYRRQEEWLSVHIRQAWSVRNGYVKDLYREKQELRDERIALEQELRDREALPA